MALVQESEAQAQGNGKQVKYDEQVGHLANLASLRPRGFYLRKVELRQGALPRASYIVGVRQKGVGGLKGGGRGIQTAARSLGR
jgi:hypothetical protein